MTRQEMVLARRAIKARWPIPDVARAAVVKECRKILESARRSTREKLAAAKILILADRLNLEQEKRDADAPPPAPPPQVTVNVAVDLSAYAAAFRTFAASLEGEAGGGGATLPPDGVDQPLDTPQAAP